MSDFSQLALIGPTASGKSALSIEVAHKNNAHILSLDSLAIYKEINIASAKPNIDERSNVQHFGLDVIFPNQPFDVTTFIQLYQEAKTQALKDQKNLIIVGGTSFYLSVLINGISELPEISEKTKEQSQELMKNLEDAYRFLYDIDKNYLKAINIHDRYRIEKMLNLYLETNMTPTEYFKAHPPKASITEDLPIYEISVERDILRKRINTRTLKMIKCGLIDEVFYLEKHYTRAPNSMKSIGIKEVLSYLDGEYTKMEMKEKILTHTAQLAKRQRTFNASQFKEKTSLPLHEMSDLLLHQAVFN
ncbi:tRNA (adenosine(37)-N6)-dimethylallyltransferase MiaA [bacterium]|nr:tRNA (adenosine(37)-N6)-dimethylallyltransferase MiaA [bacterium]MBU1959185.1 tRNA (adenosine(37)-N6)-dimethylallyltransferase MiaA [bacterium]